MAFDIIFAIVAIVILGVIVAWLELSLIKINKKLDKLRILNDRKD